MKTVRVGIMPGRIGEYAMEVGTSISDVLSLAELDATGYDVKIDGEKINNINTAVVTENTNLILLVKQIKGNAEKTVRVGVMPGRIVEYAVEVGTPISEVLELAELNTAGYEVKLDGTKVTDLENTVVGTNTNLILLCKIIKGNK